MGGSLDGPASQAHRRTSIHPSSCNQLSPPLYLQCTTSFLDFLDRATHLLYFLRFLNIYHYLVHFFLLKNDKYLSMKEVLSKKRVDTRVYKTLHRRPWKAKA
jgi:hypothetical protein